MSSVESGLDVRGPAAGGDGQAQEKAQVNAREEKVHDQGKAHADRVTGVESEQVSEQARGMALSVSQEQLLREQINISEMDSAPTPPPPSKAEAETSTPNSQEEVDYDYELTTPEGIRGYLAKTPFAGADIVPLSGGTANYVYRVRVSDPEVVGKEMVVVKHAKGWVKDFKSMKFDVGRQVFEVEALRRVRKWLPDGMVVTVPEIYLFDEKEHVIVMEDTGAESVDLKTFIKTGKATPAIAAQIGTAVGAFLGEMHAWGKGNKEICDALSGNEQAKVLTAWAFYGRLVSTLNGQDKVPKLMDPPLEVDERDLEIIARLSEETSRECLAVDDTFVMGDLWPGNIMVQLDAQGNLERMYVVDWELAKAGLLGVELGQFCAEVHMLRRCYPEVCRETATAVLDNFLEEYKKVFGGGLNVGVVRQTLTRVGAHMVVLGARVDWGDKELSRAVVLEGARLLIDGYSGALDTLSQSVVGLLM